MDIKKFLRIVCYVAAGILLLTVGVYALLQSSYVQTWLADRASRYIERTTGVKIRVGGVDLRPMRSLVLNDVLVRDFRNDTLLYCENLYVKADSFSMVNRTFNIREMVLDKAVVNLWVQDSTNDTNIEILLDALSGPSETSVGSTGKSGWWIGLQKISLRHSRFTYREEIYMPEEYGVNWTDVDCRDLNLDVTNLDFLASPMRMEVSGLSLLEKSGLEVKNMGGKVVAGPDSLLITDCHFEMAHSRVELKKLEYRWNPGQHDWKYFTTRMRQYYELGPSDVSFVDLAYFNGILRGITNTVKCSGVVSNTIDQLEGHDLYFEFGERSTARGSFRSVGLPDVWNTVFNMELTDAHFAPEDLATVYLPWFAMNIPVPAPLYKLPGIDLERVCFDGTFSDFIVRAQSVTSALEGELNFVYGPCKKESPDCVELGGDFRFNRVNFGKFTSLSMLGNGVVTGKYAGLWDEKGLSLHLKSNLPRLRLNQGNIRDISLDMLWENNRLDLLAEVDDRALGGGCACSYEKTDSLDFYSAKGELRVHDLGALGLGLATGQESVSTVFDFVHAIQQDRKFSNLTLTDLSYANENGAFTVDNLCMEDSRYKDHNTTTLKSDILDISIDGSFREINPSTFMLGLLQNYLPAYSVNRPKTNRMKRADLKQFDFEYDVRFKDLNRILRVVYPRLSISSGAHISSFFRRGEEKLYLTLSSDTLSYCDVDLLDAEIKMAGDPDCLQMDYRVGRVVYGGGYQLFNVCDELTLQNNRLDNRLSWCNWESQTYSGELSASVFFRSASRQTYTTEIQIHPGVIVMSDSVWQVNPSKILLEGKECSVHGFSIRRGNEYLSVQGKISEDPREQLRIKLENFNLENLARIALEKRLALFGMANGSLILQDYYKDFILLADFNVGQWGINRDTLGTLGFRSYWDAENRNLMMRAENRVGADIPLLMEGRYNPQTDSIKMNVSLEKVGVERLNRYTSDLFSDAAGWLSGNLAVGGMVEHPEVSGFVLLDSVGVRVNALNTKFFAHDSIRVDRNRLLFDDFILKDTKGQSALLNGEYHLTDGRYRLQSKFERFLVMNTNALDNESFYGRVALSGLAELDNLDGAVNVTVNARTEEHSQLYIPLSSVLTEQTSNFLHFTGYSKVEEESDLKTGSVSNVNLNANLEVNDLLNVQVIFDPTVGDALHTTGNGNIKIAFDKDGSLSMFGEYQISKGDYLFTLSNLVNKKFVLTPGGTINWSGSPYEAMLDINAVYNLKTTVTELLSAEGGFGDEGLLETGRKVPVECILNLSDNLSNPTVKFDINFPTLKIESRSYIQSLFSSQDEINKQVFSLLVLNHFYRSNNAGDYGVQAQTAGVTTLTEMFSNQISRWFSKYSENVDIGFAYRFGDRENELTSDELELAVSTQLLNDRLTISANGNMDVGGNRGAVDNGKNSIAGDFDVEVKLNRQGSLKMKAYSHTNERLLYHNTETIQGVGVSYQESFDTLRELLRKYFGFLRRKK